MRTYILRRLLFMGVTLVIITMVSYAMMRLAPGDPTRAAMIGGGEQGTIRQDRKETPGRKWMREKYHLDKHPLVGYGYWLRDLVTRFDWGTSITVNPGAPVMRVIVERLPVTLKLNIISIVLVYACAIPLGIFAAIRQGTLAERGTTLFLFVLYSLPVFWVGLLLLVFFAGDRFLSVFPVAGIEASRTLGVSYWWILGDTARHYVLPVTCLTYGGLAGLSRYARVGMLEVLRQDYIRTARAKGLPEWKVILKHAFRNGLIPLITLFAGLLPGLIAGSIIVEYIFSIPGMGSLSMLALSSRDYPLLMALFTIGAFLALLGILVSDIMYVIVDPRISLD